MQQLRCLYFEDEDDDFDTYKQIFEIALGSIADLVIERAKTPDEALQKLKSRGPDLQLFFADLLINEDPTEGLRLVEYVTQTFPHILVIGISKADGSHPGTSKNFQKLAGRDSVFFDKKALRSSNYTYKMVFDEIIEVAKRKGYLLSEGQTMPSVTVATGELSPNAEPRHGVDIGAKYVFLDIVGFTRNRPVEAQSDVITRLNSIVSETLAEKNIDPVNRIFIPTGDGICIALLSIEHPADISIQIALKILEQLNVYNAAMVDDSRRFQVRIGMESGDDVLVRDINRRQNIAGDGINMAARVMDLADGGQILLGERVYASLQSREKYAGKFREFDATVKHGKKTRVHQFLGERHAGLNTDSPSRLITSENAASGV